MSSNAIHTIGKKPLGRLEGSQAGNTYSKNVSVFLVIEFPEDKFGASCCVCKESFASSIQWLMVAGSKEGKKEKLADGQSFYFFSPTSQQKEVDEIPGWDLSCCGGVRVTEQRCLPTAEALLPAA